jgi:acyl carrier protein
MNMTNEQVLAQVNRIMCDTFNNQAIRLNYESSAKDVAQWDSLAHIELVVAVEKHFKIRFNFNELQKFNNVGEMCDNILTKLPDSAKNSPRQYSSPIEEG